MTERSVPDVTPDVPGPAWRALLALIQRLPQATLSRSLGAVADVRVPRPLRGAVIGGFARAVGIDTSEAEHAVGHYGSINEFFVRRLKPGLRPFPQDPRTLASPVDGIIGQHGRIDAGRAIQAKGRDYSVAALLDSADDAARYDGGTFITIYLSPSHYHRIHAPYSGRIARAVHVPGALLPVNEPGVQHIPDLFPRSERVICTIDGAAGRCALVAVGAYNVGRISTAFDPEWAGPGASVANRRDPVARERSYDPPLEIAQGDELMAFHLGSTVVILCEPGWVSACASPGTGVRLGQPLLRA